MNLGLPVRTRRGMSIMEVMVVVAILLALVAVLVPSTASLLQLRQRRAAKDIVFLYHQLHDEAILRNVTFRVAFYLDENTYKVEVGEPGALVFDNPEELAEFKERTEDKLRMMSDEEREEWKERVQPFEKLGERFSKQFELPSGVVFGGIYTPQYGEMITPDYDDESDVLLGVDFDQAGMDDGEARAAQRRVYSYVFANGMAEHTVIWLVDESDPEEGFTIEIEPLSGAVHLHGELIDWEDSYDFVPSEGPELSL